MKTLLFMFITLLLNSRQGNAQITSVSSPGLPITVSVFAESISLPTFKRVQKGGFGIKLGTEFYYHNRPGSQFIQAVTVGYYHHPAVQNGLFVHSALGYRAFVGHLVVDAFLGGGALLVRPYAPSYERDGNTGDYQSASATQLRFMPAMSAGVGYRFPNQATVFANYELFGEMPFRSVVLPHQAFAVGTRFLVNR